MPRSCAPLLLYVESLSAAHAFAMVRRLICAFYHSSLTSYGINCFLVFHSLLACSFEGLGLAWLRVFPLLAHSLASSIVLLSFLLYHPAIHAVVLFDLCLLGLFEPDAYSSLNDSIWSLDFMLLWAFLTHYIARGLLCPISFILEHPWPICFPQASLAHFLTLHSHGLLLTLLGFPDLITLFFILGAHGLSTNPYFLASLSRACCGLFLLFYIS